MKLKMSLHNSTDKSEHDKSKDLLNVRIKGNDILEAERIIHDQRKLIASLREEVSFLFAKFEQKSQHDRYDDERDWMEFSFEHFQNAY